MVEISVFVTSDQTSSERRINPQWTIAELKNKLEVITGIPPASQSLSLYGVSKISLPTQIVANVSKGEDETTKTLESYTIDQYGRIHVDDSRPAAQRENYTDVSEVEKYVMPEDEYAKRQDSVLAWKKRNRLGRFTEDGEGEKSSTHLQKQEEIEIKAIQTRSIDVGKRCRVTNVGDSDSERRGTVKFIGKVPEIKSSHLYWVGVEYDEPLGKNNGSIQGKKYFDAKPNYGSFVLPDLVEVGDFPELSLLSDDEEL